MWLRVKLTAVFVGVITLPLALVLGALWLGGAEVARGDAMRDLNAATRSLIATIEGRLALDLGHLKALAGLPVMQDTLIADGGRDIARAIGELKVQYPEFARLVATDARGAVIASTSEVELGRSLAEDEGYRAAASGSVHQGGLAVREAGVSSVSFSVPVIAAYDRQTVIGTLSATIDFAVLAKAAKAQSILSSHRDVIVLGDGSGRTVFASRSDGALLGSVQELASRRSRDGEITWRGAPYFVASAPSKGEDLVRDPRFVAFAVTPAAPTFALVDQLLAIAAAVAAVGALAASALAWRWSTPLVRFGTAIARLARGDAGVRPPEVKSNHTFGPLARAFESLRQMRSMHDWLVKRERELQTAKDDAEEALRQKSEHLASLARALKAELSTIIALSEAINAETLKAAAAPERASHAKDISRSGAQLMAVINDLFDLSEAEAGHAMLREAEIDLAALVNDSVEVMREAADKGKVAIACEVGDQTLIARIDAQKIKQVMFNLLSNAIKFTPEGGRVCARLKTDADGRAVIAIQDTGIGMPAGLPPMAAGVLSGSAADAHAQGRHGAGLGLPLARELIDMHDGTIEIESESGKGTTVTVTLPAARVVAQDQNARLIA